MITYNLRTNAYSRPLIESVSASTFSHHRCRPFPPLHRLTCCPQYESVFTLARIGHREPLKHLIIHSKHPVHSMDLPTITEVQQFLS